MKRRARQVKAVYSTATQMGAKPHEKLPEGAIMRLG